MQKKTKSIEDRIRIARMLKASLMGSLITVALILSVFGVWYTLSNITGNAIIATVYISIIIVLCCVIVTFLYTQIPKDKYDYFYNTSLSQMADNLNTEISIYRKHSINQAKEEGKKTCVYYQLEEVQEEI